MASFIWETLLSPVAIVLLPSLAAQILQDISQWLDRVFWWEEHAIQRIYPAIGSDEIRLGRLALIVERDIQRQAFHAGIDRLAFLGDRVGVYDCEIDIGAERRLHRLQLAEAMGAHIFRRQVVGQ